MLVVKELKMRGKCMAGIVRGNKLDFELEDVQAVYEGPVGVLWEMLMGEEIHVGGEAETDILAEKAGINSETHVLDICSALGGPARHLARKYGCRVTGLDATKKMVDEADKRTEKEGLTELISYKLGSCLDIPFESDTFDVVWGQDAWCYVTDKKKLITEAKRVMKPKGAIAFTDWIQTGSMSEEEWELLNSFMVFPYMETLEGYELLMIQAGYDFIEKEDLSEDFAAHCHLYQDKLRNELKDGIIQQYGTKLFKAADDGLALWVSAADEGKMGRGRWIGRKLR
jgi:ubiquinone/menaquinone biosynthesis C-methylase UbiE